MASENAPEPQVSPPVTPEILKNILSGLEWLGLKLLYGAETIGEVVANVLGLNESKYQYVIDGMTEEDWKVAREIQAKRQREEGISPEDVETAVETETLDEKIKRTQQTMLLFKE